MEENKTAKPRIKVPHFEASRKERFTHYHNEFKKNMRRN